jgi:hypothetical protein
MTFDDVCSCLVALYRWSIVGRDWWLFRTDFLHELEAIKERPLKDEAAFVSRRRLAGAGKRGLGLKPALRLEWRGQDGQDEAEQPEHYPLMLGDSVS